MPANLRDINKFLVFNKNTESEIVELDKITANRFYDKHGRITPVFGPDGDLSFAQDGALVFRGNRVVSDAENLGTINATGNDMTADTAITVNGISFADNDEIAPAGNTLLFNASAVEFNGDLENVVIGGNNRSEGIRTVLYEGEERLQFWLDGGWRNVFVERGKSRDLVVDSTTYPSVDIPDGTISYTGGLFRFRQDGVWVGLDGGTEGIIPLGNYQIIDSDFGHVNQSSANIYGYGSLDFYADTPNDPDFGTLTPVLMLEESTATMTNAVFTPNNAGYSIASDGTEITGSDNAFSFNIGGVEKVNIDGTNVDIEDIGIAGDTLTNNDGNIVINSSMELNATSLGITADTTFNGDITLNGGVNVNSKVITGVPEPKNGTEVANKDYVDDEIEDRKDRLLDPSDVIVAQATATSLNINQQIERDNFHLAQSLGNTADPFYIVCNGTGSGTVYSNNFKIALSWDNAGVAFTAHNCTVQSITLDAGTALEVSSIPVGEAIYANGSPLEIATAGAVVNTTSNGVQISNNVQINDDGLNLDGGQIENVSRPTALHNVATRQFAEDSERLSIRRKLTLAVAGDREQLQIMDSTNPLFWTFYSRLVINIEMTDAVASNTALSSDLSTQLSTIIGNEIPDVLLFTAGRNDLDTGNVETFIDDALTAGVQKVIFLATWPDDNNSINQSINVNNFNNIIHEKAINNSRVAYVGASLALESPDDNIYSYYEAMSYNGDDLSTLGAFDYSEVIAEEMRKYENPRIPRAISSSNYYSGSNMGGNVLVNGVPDGFGTGWTISSTGTITAGSSTVRSDYIKKINVMRATLSGTPDNNANEITFTYSNAITAPASPVRFEFVIQYSNLQNVSLFNVSFVDGIKPAVNLIEELPAQNMDNFLPENGTIVFQSNDTYTITGTIMDVIFRFQTIQGAEIAGTIDVGFLGAYI